LIRFDFPDVAHCIESLNWAKCQVVLEAGPNDLPWPDDAKSKEKGVTVCALCFGCREGWLFGWPSESQQGLSEGVNHG